MFYRVTVERAIAFSCGMGIPQKTFKILLDSNGDVVFNKSMETRQTNRSKQTGAD